MTAARGAGLDGAGFIARDVSAANIQPVYRSVVTRLVALSRAAFGDELHGLYLYGSVPRGTAAPGRSDLDVLLVLTVAPGDSHRSQARDVAETLQRDYPFVPEVGIVLSSAAEIVSRRQRYDMGFFVACLCACVAGDDLAPRLPRYRPSRSLAKGTNGNIAQVLVQARTRLAVATDADAVRAICRGSARKIVRTGFTLVMPEARVWTSDLAESARIFARYYPAQAAAMDDALRLALNPTAHPPAAAHVLDTLGAWLAREYAVKIPGHGATAAARSGYSAGT